MSSTFSVVKSLLVKGRGSSLPKMLKCLKDEWNRYRWRRCSADVGEDVAADWCKEVRQSPRRGSPPETESWRHDTPWIPPSSAPRNDAHSLHTIHNSQFAIYNAKVKADELFIRQHREDYLRTSAKTVLFCNYKVAETTTSSQSHLQNGHVETGAQNFKDTDPI